MQCPGRFGPLSTNLVLSSFDQTIEHLKKSKNIVIALPQEPSVDALASGLALYSVLEHMTKKVKVVSDDFRMPPQSALLPKSSEVRKNLTALKKFVINVDVSKAPVEELSYDIHDNALQIFITPKSGFFRDRDVTFSSSDYEFDLIIVLDAPDLESLGKLYDDNAEFFYHTPIVNIDHSPKNDHFGQMNIVDLTATSTSEIVFELLQKIDPGILDEYLATHLLTGIISKTKSFQTTSVTPKSLTIASHLISSGARRDDIVKHLYQTKSLPMLKLWGRVLARLRSEPELKMVWSVLNASDFDRAGATAEVLEGVIDELIVNVPEADVVMVLYEDNDHVSGIVYTPPARDGMALLAPFFPRGSKDFTHIQVETHSVKEAETLMLDHFRKVLTKPAPLA